MAKYINVLTLRTLGKQFTDHVCIKPTLALESKSAQTKNNADNFHPIDNEIGQAVVIEIFWW